MDEQPQETDAALKALQTLKDAFEEVIALYIGRAEGSISDADIAGMVGKSATLHTLSYALAANICSQFIHKAGEQVMAAIMLSDFIISDLGDEEE